MTKHGGERILERGAWGSLVAIEFSNGDCPAFEFLSGLTDREQSGIKARMIRLAEQGTQKAPENFRWLKAPGDPSVAELKHTGLNLRLYLIKGDHKYYATHGRKKPKDRQVPAEVEKAQRLWKEWVG